VDGENKVKSRILVPRLLLTTFVSLWIASSAMAQSVTFTEHKLKNGLRVILSEDHSAPTYSISVTYNVGSRDERDGRTGFAHLFEHMMFQGSENVGKGEHFIIIENNGGGLNGSTNGDRTEYHETLPANQLDLGLFLEADRMKSLAITLANLDNQRETVKEERRQRVDNQPYGLTFDTLFETAYDNFAYKHSTIGSMEDLSAATVKDVSDFFKTYYAPNNAVLTLVGDFKTSEVVQKIEKYFGGIPSQPPPRPPDVSEPKQNGERRKTLEDPLAQVARLDIAGLVHALCSWRDPVHGTVFTSLSKPRPREAGRRPGKRRNARTSRSIIVSGRSVHCARERSEGSREACIRGT
jgi:zinc protease